MLVTYQQVLDVNMMPNDDTKGSISMMHYCTLFFLSKQTIHASTTNHCDGESVR